GTTSILCFFFQAEDGIRDFHVTGVQTCALPISSCSSFHKKSTSSKSIMEAWLFTTVYFGFSIGLNNNNKGFFKFKNIGPKGVHRSEERRVGKGCGVRGITEDKNNSSGSGTERER